MPTGIIIGILMEWSLWDAGGIGISYDNLTDKLPVHHITIFASEDILVNHTSNGKHSKTSIVHLLVLVRNPSLITVVNPVGGSKKITRLISRSLLNLLSEPLNSTTSEHELNPTNSGELNHGLKRIVGKSTVEGGVDSTGVEVPSEAGSHGNTAMFELGFPVVFHGDIILALGKSEGVEEASRGGDTNHSILNPCRKLGGGGNGLCGGKGGSRCNKGGDNSGLHG
mmetsp:Transcript_11870/g.25516  ORF Transcript_11870/g.25516 Transcript_11870/m.25516 type:complete len:225 (+) Transcript_11870:231-905(+)